MTATNSSRDYHAYPAMSCAFLWVGVHYLFLSCCSVCLVYSCGAPGDVIEPLDVTAFTASVNSPPAIFSKLSNSDQVYSISAGSFPEAWIQVCKNRQHYSNLLVRCCTHPCQWRVNVQCVGLQVLAVTSYLVSLPRVCRQHSASCIRFPAS